MSYSLKGKSHDEIKDVITVFKEDLKKEILERYPEKWVDLLGSDVEDPICNIFESCTFYISYRYNYDYYMNFIEFRVSASWRLGKVNDVVYRTNKLGTFSWKRLFGKIDFYEQALKERREEEQKREEYYKKKERLNEKRKKFVSKVVPSKEVRGRLNLRYNSDGFSINVSGLRKRQLEKVIDILYKGE